MIRVLVDVKTIRQHWERRSDELPYLIATTSDGRVVRFNPEIPQPGFQKAMNNIKNMEGYKYERDPLQKTD